MFTLVNCVPLELIVLVVLDKWRGDMILQIVLVNLDIMIIIKIALNVNTLVLLVVLYQLV